MSKSRVFITTLQRRGEVTVHECVPETTDKLWSLMADGVRLRHCEQLPDNKLHIVVADASARRFMKQINRYSLYAICFYCTQLSQ